LSFQEYLARLKMAITIILITGFGDMSMPVKGYEGRRGRPPDTARSAAAAACESAEQKSVAKAKLARIAEILGTRHEASNW
jgi:hypothetical protein